MKVELKTWAGLGLATALAGASLAGCSGEAGEAGVAGEGGESAQVGEGGEGEGGESAGGEGGESGEGGEGGVSIAEAATDPVVYGAALAIAEAHVIAARDAYAAGKKEAAAEMFAHPVGEVMAEMDPVFAKLGVADFKPLFGAASQAALAGESIEVVDQRFEAIIAALRNAATKAPTSDATQARVAAGVIADQIERAVAMYPEAVSSGRYEPYLDGYGYYKAGASAFAASGDAIRREDPKLYERIAKALELLGTAYPAAKLPAKLDANQGALSGASAGVMLAVS
jgi:hypothetical protein